MLTHLSQLKRIYLHICIPFRIFVGFFLSLSPVHWLREMLFDRQTNRFASFERSLWYLPHNILLPKNKSLKRCVEKRISDKIFFFSQFFFCYRAKYPPNQAVMWFVHSGENLSCYFKSLLYSNSFMCWKVFATIFNLNFAL